MSTFSLRIGTPDGLLFEGDVERVTFVLLLEWGKPVSSWQMETDELRPVLEGCFLL